MMRFKVNFSRDELLANALLYLLLLGVVGITYAAVLVVTLLLGLIQTSALLVVPPWWINLVVAVVAAPALFFLHRWLEVHVHTLIYGQYDNPYAVVSRISPRLQMVTDPGRGLPVLAEAIAGELHLPWVAIEGPAGAPHLKGVYGRVPARAAVTRLALEYQGEELGALSVSTRGANRPLTPDDLVLLKDVARQVSIVFYELQLRANLQATREQLVIAREEERRRIRNDLHDGLAPTLASLHLQLGALRKRLRADPDRAEAEINEMRADLSVATASIRQLVYDLRPPLLDELGLVAAIHTLRLGDGGLQLEVTAPEPMPRLPAAVEVAAWRICSEAITNTAKHAGAANCHISIVLEPEALVVRICDDGCGFPSVPASGVGMTSMRERALELGGAFVVEPNSGGGTCVTARLPVNASSIG